VCTREEFDIKVQRKRHYKANRWKMALVGRLKVSLLNPVLYGPMTQHADVSNPLRSLAGKHIHTDSVLEKDGCDT
jgi:hypothetical protein